MNGISLIDWQTASLLSPAVDVGNFLLWCTEKPLRDHHFDQLLHIYHGELTRVITACGSDANALFSYDDLLGQLREFGLNTLGVAPFAVSIMVTKPEAMGKIADIGSDDNSKANNFAPLNVESTLRYKQVLSDMINDAKRLGYVEK